MRCTRVLLPFIVLFLTVNCFSQVDTSKVKDLVNLSFAQLLDVDITTASKKTEKISEAPATVYVITKADIKARGYVYLKDIFRDLPGMESIENYFSEQGTLVPVRGVIGNNKIVVLLNGQRVNPPGGEEMMFRSDFNILQAKQIEIIYGLGSTLYGQDAINAVINVITEQPGDKGKLDIMGRGGMYNNKEGAVSFSSRLSGSQDNYIGLSSAISLAENGLSNLDKEYPDWWNNNYRNIATRTGIRQTPYRFDKGLNAFVRLESATSSLQIFHRESARSSAEGGYSGVLQYANEAIWHDRTTVISGTNNLNFNDKLDLNSSMSFSRYEIDPESRYVYPVNDSTIFLNDFKYGIGKVFKVEEQLNYVRNDKFSIIGGIVTSFYGVTPKATIPGGADPSMDITSQAGSFIYYTRKGDSTSKVLVPRAYNINYRVYAAYAEATYLLVPKFKAILGLRVDRDTRFSAVPLSPRIALVYSLSSNLNFKYIFNKGYVAPAAYFGYNVFDNGVQINTSNPNLQAERAMSNEISINYLNNKLSIITAFYYNNQENLIVLEDGRVNPENLVQDSVYVNPDGTGVRELTRTANSGSSQSWGADIFGTYKSEKLSVWMSFSYVNFKRVLNHVTTGLDNISPVNIRFGVTWQPVNKLSVTPGLIFRTTPQNITNTAGLDKEIKNPYEINVHVNYEPIKCLTVFVDGRNITDNKYALKGIIGPTPQEPIQLLAGIRYILK